MDGNSLMFCGIEFQTVGETGLVSFPNTFLNLAYSACILNVLLAIACCESVCRVCSSAVLAFLIAICLYHTYTATMLVDCHSLVLVDNTLGYRNVTATNIVVPGHAYRVVLSMLPIRATMSTVEHTTNSRNNGDVCTLCVKKFPHLTSL